MPSAPPSTSGPAKVEVLIKLADGPMTLREIARAVEVDPPAATVGVDQLEARGLVHRTAHPDDNRRKLVHLTDAGRDAARRGQAILNEPPPNGQPGPTWTPTTSPGSDRRLRTPASPDQTQSIAEKEPRPCPQTPSAVALRNRHAGHHTLVWARPDLQAPENFTLTSPAFDHGTPIPERHRGRLFGANISPALAWTTPPAGTAELVLIVQDPDVPLGKPATHALTLGIDPSLSGIPENGLTDPSPIPGLKHGKGALGRRGWAGPMPPRSHGPHSYVFQLFALDHQPDLPDKFTLADALHAMAGHVIARARLDGTYEIR